ncbi:MAG TPA: CocE/NonD family hydrolase [Anaerolineales bacterium]|nr:CocE/NonD family hydrolase [Anaerolineales bacterium]
MVPRRFASETETKIEKEKENLLEINFKWGVKIPMGDSVLLNATLYCPKTDKPVPAIFTLTPYIADSYHPRAEYFARRGLAFVLVDCRGRGNSEGIFEPFIHESRDGSDIVAWLAEQSWCDGSVTMWGGSYGGFDQWMTLKQFPPQLKTIVPAASAHAGIDFPFFKNILFPYEMQWQTLVSGLTPNAILFAESSFWIEKFRQLYLNQRPFRELDQVVGNPSPAFQTFIQHPMVDDYWKQMWLTPQEYHKIDLPILTITGHYDGDQPGAMHYYRQHMLHGKLEARARHFLLIGPWDHAGTRTPNREFGGMKFGEASLVDLNKLHLDWYRWTMLDGPQPEFLKKRVAYYLMGAETWKYADRLEDISNEKRRFYLASQAGQANDVFHSGDLSDELADDPEPDSYIYDPLDLRPAELEKEEIKNYLVDQRYELNLFGNGLVYHSQPFEEDTEVTGFVRLEAWMELDAPDTDFLVTLSEILLDGRRIQLAQDMLRARHRLSLEEENLVPVGEIMRYEFNGFNFFSRQIAKGSRLRLLISSPNSIHFQKNYNSGKVVANESKADARTVQVKLYHSPMFPSFLEIPVVRSEKG